MPHPLVVQLRFTRSEFCRALEGVSDTDARRRVPPMNCISFNVGHLAAQEQYYWLSIGQNRVLLPALRETVGYGAPASTPPLDKMWDAWRTVTTAADPWLDTLSTASLLEQHTRDNRTITFGNLLQRVIYHYWYHTGENMAIRQMLGHTDLPEFVGQIDSAAPFIADTGT